MAMNGIPGNGLPEPAGPRGSNPKSPTVKQAMLPPQLHHLPRRGLVSLRATAFGTKRR